MDLKELENSKLYSEELGIDLSGKDSQEIFKWFLASILFGARISETIAKNTYKTFEKYDLLSPKKILEKDRGYLINPIMREGGYVRYDGKTSDQVLRNCKKLLEDYNGDLNELHQKARDSRDLENRLLEFHGIGQVTVNIFLRELRPYWKKANPKPLPRIKKIAKKLGINLESYNRKTEKFTRLEAGLFRKRKELG